MLKAYRPAGNPVLIEASEFDPQDLGATHAMLYQSGTAALAAAIRACQQLSEQRQEVILPAYGCPDLVSAVVHAGARPVLVDLEPDSHRLSLDDLQKKLGPGTLAIVSVVFLGLRDRIETLRKKAQEAGARLILDSAQWFPCTPSENDWEGDFNILSFGRGKPVNLLHGGAVICNDQRLARALPVGQPSGLDAQPDSRHLFKLRLYNTLIHPLPYGLISRMPGLHIGETRYKTLSGIEAMSRFHHRLIHSNVQAYRKARANSRYLRRRLDGLAIEGWRDLTTESAVEDLPPLLRYPVLLDNKESRQRFLDAARSLGCSPLYDRPMAQLKGLEFLEEKAEDYPAARKLAGRLVTLPTHVGMPEAVLDRIVGLLEDMIRTGARGPAG